MILENNIRNDNAWEIDNKIFYDEWWIHELEIVYFNLSSGKESFIELKQIHYNPKLNQMGFCWKISMEMTSPGPIKRANKIAY